MNQFITGQMKENAENEFITHEWSLDVTNDSIRKIQTLSCT